MCLPWLKKAIHVSIMFIISIVMFSNKDTKGGLETMQIIVNIVTILDFTINFYSFIGSTPTPNISVCCSRGGALHGASTATNFQELRICSSFFISINSNSCILARVNICWNPPAIASDSVNKLTCIIELPCSHMMEASAFQETNLFRRS